MSTAVAIMLLSIGNVSVLGMTTLQGRWMQPSHRSLLMRNDVLGPPLRSEEFEDSMTLAQNYVPLSIDRDPIELAGLFQGDIVLEAPIFVLRNAEADPAKRWKDGIIPYVISSSYDKTERITIAKAMQEIQSNSCIRFVPHTTETDYIHLMKAYGCSSAVGRAGGSQLVTLDTSCLYVGVIIHELMHVAGFWHEHSRNDRDAYITINKSNVQAGRWSNFQKYSWEEAKSLGVSYDLDSVMHYGPYAFAKDRSLPTIIPRVMGSEMGQRQGLSKKDILKLRELYECGARKDLPSVTTQTTLSSTELCQNMNDHCQLWASAGECDNNPAWMNVNCKKACGKCVVRVMPCWDKHEHCRTWAAKNECTRNPDYMLSYCKMSCSQC